MRTRLAVSLLSQVMRLFAILSAVLTTVHAQNPARSNLADVLSATDELSVFVGALKASRHWEQIRNSDDLVLFIPVNQSLEAEGSAFLLEAVLPKPENSIRLDDLIGLHIVQQGSVLEPIVSNTVTLQTMSGECIRISQTGDGKKVEPEAKITGSRIAENGRIYFVDRLLWVPYNQDAVTNCNGLSN